MTEFTTWRSLVDGDEISDIPDSENVHLEYIASEQPESDGETVDKLIDQSDNNRDSDESDTLGSPILNADGFNNEPTIDIGADEAFFTDVDLPSTVCTLYVVVAPPETNVDHDYLREGNDVIFEYDDDSGYVTDLRGDAPAISRTEANEEVIAYVADSGADEALVEVGQGDESDFSDDASDRTVDLSNIGIGGRGDDKDTAGNDTGYGLSHYLLYETAHFDSDTRNDVYDYLSSKQPI